MQWRIPRDERQRISHKPGENRRQESTITHSQMAEPARDAAFDTMAKAAPRGSAGAVTTKPALGGCLGVGLLVEYGADALHAFAKAGDALAAVGGGVD